MKCVTIIDGSLPNGLIANTAAVLGVSLGNKMGNISGPDVYDASGGLHTGLIRVPIPILTAEPEKMRSIREAFLAGAGSHDTIMVDVSNVAQISKDYESYTVAINRTDSNELTYLGLALYGSKKFINKLTGSLPLFR